MSKTIDRHLINVHSELDVNGKKWNDENVVAVAKAPSAEDLVYGEFAINNGKGYETVFIKNSNDEVIPLPNNIDIEALTSAYTQHNNSLGFNENGEYIPNENDTYIAESETVTEALDILDGTVKDLTDKVIEDEEATVKGIHSIVEAAGIIDDDGNIIYTPNTACTYISAATSLQNADTLLDNTINTVSGKVENIISNAVTAITSEDNSVIVTKKTKNTYDLKVEIPESTISNKYELVEYDETFGADTVAVGDTFEEAINTVEKAVELSVEKILENEEVTANGFKAVAEAGGILNEDGVITYMKDTNTKYIKDAESLANADSILDEAIKDLSEKAIIINGDEVIENVNEIEQDLFIVTSALTRMNESVGLTQNIRYNPASEVLKEQENLVNAVDYLADLILDLTSRIEKLEGKFDTY